MHSSITPDYHRLASYHYIQSIKIAYPNARCFPQKDRVGGPDFQCPIHSFEFSCNLSSRRWRTWFSSLPVVYGAGLIFVILARTFMIGNSALKYYSTRRWRHHHIFLKRSFGWIQDRHIIQVFYLWDSGNISCFVWWNFDWMAVHR